MVIKLHFVSSAVSFHVSWPWAVLVLIHSRAVPEFCGLLDSEFSYFLLMGTGAIM